MKATNVAYLCLFSTLVVGKDQIDQAEVDYYVEFMNNHTEAAIAYQFPTDARMHEATDQTLRDFGEFDFIIVGAGSAGCVVAHRLAEIAGWSVLLLEAGTFPDEDLTGIPGMTLADVLTKFNWGFESVPQTTAFQGNPSKTCPVAKGKGVGGSSLINGLAYTRGNKHDYDKWAELLNEPGWNYDNVLPYFRKSETFLKKSPYSPIDTEYHGYNGPLHMTESAPPLDMTPTILKGIEQLGYNITDANGKEQMGGSIYQMYMKDGRRLDPNSAFITPILKKKNFKAIDRSYVIKIEIDDASKRATGVIFTRDNKTFIARSRKEIILSAGAVSTPQILMLSGIGPQDHLQSLGIPVIRNLPVGKHLIDHTISYITFSSNITNIPTTVEESVRDLIKGKGTYTRVSLFDIWTWFKTPVEQTENYPDVEFVFANISSNALFDKYYGFSEDVLEVLAPDVPSRFSIEIVVLHKKSRGTVQLKSADPFEYPLVDPNLLSDENNSDLETMYQSVQLASKLIDTEVFRSLNASLVISQVPGCEDTEPNSREYWYCYFRHITVVGLHQLGTCLTGTNPTNGVVDKNLRVFGIGGLRIADASVVPLPITGHTNAVCSMVGEKAADLIKASFIREPSLWL